MINAAHLHLMLNTVPLIVTSVALAILVWGVVRTSEEVIRVGLMLLVAVALVTVVVFKSGDRAVLVVGELPGVSLQTIGDHHEVASKAVWAVEVTGFVALAGLIAFRSPRVLPRWFVALVVLLGIVSGGAVAETSRIGGGIRHPEARSAPKPIAP